MKKWITLVVVCECICLSIWHSATNIGWYGTTKKKAQLDVQSLCIDQTTLCSHIPQIQCVSWCVSTRRIDTKPVYARGFWFYQTSQYLSQLNVATVQFPFLRPVVRELDVVGSIRVDPENSGGHHLVFVEVEPAKPNPNPGLKRRNLSKF